MNKRLTSIRNTIFILFIAIILAQISFALLSNNKANAYFEWPVGDCPVYRGPFRGDTPNGWNVPSDIYFYLNRADCNPWSPSSIFYVTTATSATSSSITVPSGTPSVDLALRGAATVGWRTSSALLTRYTVVGASAGVSGIVNEFAQTDLSGGPNTPGHTSLSAPNTFTFAPPGGFTSSGIYSGTLTVRVAQSFNNRGPACVASGTNASSIAGSNCPNSLVGFNINVTVTPPPIRGCTDPAANNYNPAATINDGSCTYNRLPSGSISASCTNGSLSVSVSGSDPDGGNVTFTLTGAHGQGTNPTRTNAGSFGPYSRPRDGVSYTLTGTVSDAQTSATVALTSATYTCAVPPPSITSCLINVSTSTISAGVETFTISIIVNRNQDANSPAIANLTATASIPGGSPASVSGTSGSFAIGTGARTIALTTPSPNVSIASAGIVTITGSATGNSGTLGPVVCTSTTVRNAELPYIKVDGADLSAGYIFENTSTSPYTCSFPTPPNPAGRIIGYTAFSGAPADYRGASAQLAAFARGSIEGFYSRDDRAVSTNGATLAFANTVNTAPSAGDYGGQFGGSTCIKDYFLLGQKPGIATTTGNITDTVGGLAARANPTTKQLLINGNLTVSATPSHNQQISVFVNGNVYINGNVLGNPGAYANASQIPFFGIIARGNIYIAGGVSQVDAFMVAQPSYTGNAFTPNTGVVYTCATGLGSPVVENTTAPSELNTSCRNPLTVNGYVIANRIKLLRVGGHRDAAPFNNSPSERFNATPELFLLDELPLNSLDGTYDAAASLPPIL